MTVYYRPLLQRGAARPQEALTLGGGWTWFTHAERLERGIPAQVVAADAVPEPWLSRLVGSRPSIAGLNMDRPRVMGILNVTPDSFSDGGAHESVAAARAQAQALAQAGADLIDVGGESTRPGAQEVDVKTEIARTGPVVEAMREAGLKIPISLDTRKEAVARAVPADLINDVSGFTFDPGLATLAVETGRPVCLMHSQGTPETMQDAPQYDDVLLDVYDWLEARIEAVETKGIPRAHILADPGIGFGKTFDHNMALLRGLSLFHGLGTALLLGVSRKGFIGHIANVQNAQERAPGSVAVALYALGQGAHVIRAHDVAEHVQAIALWRACVA